MRPYATAGENRFRCLPRDITWLSAGVRFMADVVIKMRAHGPLLVEGPFTLLDSHGTPFKLNPEKPAIALCRCGHSKNKPFCDGAHKGCSFVSDEIAPTIE